MFPTTYPLMNWDEAWYGEIIKNLVSGKHSWLVPFWNGSLFFDKPPLYFWLSFPVVKFFGVGEWQMRLVAIIAGALCVLFTYLIAQYLYGKKTGLLASLILISLGQVWFRFNSADLDSLQVFLSLSCIYFFIKSKKYPNLILSGIFLGLSFLVKSWLLGLFPFAFLSIFCLSNDRSRLRDLVTVFLTSLFFSGWWYLAGSFIYGKEFISWYLLSPAAGNFHAGVNFLTPYYFKVIITDIGLWLVPLFSLFIFKHQQIKPTKFIFPVLLITILFVGVLQFSADKFNWYLLPLYPLFAICLAYLFALIDYSKFRLFAFLLVFSFLGQVMFGLFFYYHDPDLSRVGADLGKVVRQKVVRGETIILDGRDFPSFIYYSDLGHVLVSTPDGGKAREPWIISYSALQKLPRPFWVVTKGWQNLGLGFPKEIVNLVYDYRLVKFDTSPIKP